MRKLMGMSKRAPDVGYLKAYFRLLKDPGAGFFSKLVVTLSVLGSVAYALSPIDFIPDVPVIGWLDDIGILAVAGFLASFILRKYKRAEEAAPVTIDTHLVDQK